ncbi:MAG: acylphosphatase [Phycisphaerales bacterium]
MRYSGRVQGVGFRATTRWIASQHPVTGWVRNEEDGGVLLEAQGEGSALELFLETVRTRLAATIAVENAVTVGVIEGEQGFELRR